MWRQLMPALKLAVALMVLTGIAYPALVTGLCQAFWPSPANGSLVRRNGRVIGSALIAQGFTQPGYFHPRPSAAGAGYDASNSGGSNLGPTSRELISRVAAAVKAFHQDNPAYHGAVPVDMVTTSASGLDPDISLASADAQAARVAQARGITLAQVNHLVQTHAEQRILGFFGEPFVNVLELNLALDRLRRAAQNNTGAGASPPGAPRQSSREGRTGAPGVPSPAERQVGRAAKSRGAPRQSIDVR